MDINILIAALLPAVVLICFICFRDRKNPEPISQLLKGVGWGIASAFLAIIAGDFIPSFGIDDHASLVGNIYTAFFNAAIPEEIAKAICLYYFLRRNRHFDEYMDGIVYAVCIGMGFAGLENILYLFNSPDWLALSISRGLLSVPGHFAFAVIMGYYFSLWRINRQPDAFVKMLLYPILAHGIYDTLAFSLDISEATTGLIVILLFAFLHKLRQHCSRLIATHLRNDNV